MTRLQILSSGWNGKYLQRLHFGPSLSNDQSARIMQKPLQDNEEGEIEQNIF
jgi:hypothetical protein